MILKSISILKRSIFLIYADKRVLLLSMVPVLLTILFYMLGAFFFFGPLLLATEGMVLGLIPLSIGVFAHYLLLILFSVGFYFFFSWTVIAIISVLAWPFNRQILKLVDPTNEKNKINIIKELFDEFQKMFIIFLLAVFNFALALVPAMSLFSVAIAGLLIAWQFLDYTWSHHQLSFKHCGQDVLKNKWTYIFNGVIFLFLSAVPVVNMIIPSWATIHFNLLYHSKQD